MAKCEEEIYNELTTSETRLEKIETLIRKLYQDSQKALITTNYTTLDRQKYDKGRFDVMNELLTEINRQ